MFGFYELPELLQGCKELQEKKDFVISATNNSLHQVISTTVISWIISRWTIVTNNNIINNHVKNE